MKNLIITRYHGPTNTRGSRISVRGFVPDRGIVRRVYSYDYSGRAHDSAASEFLAEFFRFFPRGSPHAGRKPDRKRLYRKGGSMRLSDAILFMLAAFFLFVAYVSI